MLNISNLSAWYGEAQALAGLDLEIQAGQVVTLVGRNGAGKTTTLRCLMGMHQQMRGQIVFGNDDITAWAPHRRARAGLGYVPDDRGIYASLTVEENLSLPPSVGADGWSLERIYEFFPNLRDRRRSFGTTLSGGEQQMLSIARVLRMGARLLLMDEPTEGLAPVLVQQIGQLVLELKQHGMTILLIEQNLRFATRVADWHYLLVHGNVVEAMSNDQVKVREHELLRYLGV
ncbi:MAG: ABC transporter ATP-binding protein [Chloroflexota bacterium]|nr:ABC transporter ATP-binding protein [Chloroflexota bacterium]